KEFYFRHIANASTLYAILLMLMSQTHIDTLRQDKGFLFRLVLSVGLFLFSGLASTYLYYQFNKTGGAFFPGLLYTSSTVLIFVLTKKVTSTRNLFIYYGLMNLTYLAAVLLTFLSSYFGVFVGIITGGAGAVITFILTSKYIVNIKFRKLIVFILGGLAFLMTDILYFIFSSVYDTTPIESIFQADISPGILFCEVFVFWHVLVGTKLFLTLQETSEKYGIQQRFAAIQADE